MPVDPLRLLAIIDETPHEGLRTLDRETLLATQKVLKALKKEVDRTLLRLAFVDEQQLN
jgi:hypothetical protein